MPLPRARESCRQRKPTIRTGRPSANFRRRSLSARRRTWPSCRRRSSGRCCRCCGYATAHEPIAYVNAHDRPLALYWFGSDRAARDQVLARTVSGGVTVNDCLFHFAQVNQPMGGVGASGTGAYHGEWGFRTFSKLKPVFYRSPFNRLADLYPPYGAKIARLEKTDAVHVVANSTVIARSERRSNPEFACSALDCFAEPVIGPRFARTRWLAMTKQNNNEFQSRGKHR